MKIDITCLNQNLTNEINLDSDITLEGENYQEEDIKELKKLHLKGSIYLNEEREIELNLTLTGIMIVEDSISLENIEYPFTCNIMEIYEKNDENLINTLDISDILWQNIVLEVPLRFTKVDDYSKFKGEGWELLSEDSKKSSNNPFKDLKDMFGEE